MSAINCSAGTEAAVVDERRPAAAQLLWIPFFLALVLWVAHRLGAFDLSASLAAADGALVRVPNGFGSVDHPFHTARAESLRRALADGDLLRWSGSHQGGYPVEFYPLGAAALDVIGWGLAMGSLPMTAVHKLVVIAIFIFPLAGYLLMAGFDRRSYGVALVAGAGHLCVRGWWWSGGSMELVEWGLVTNVAAAAALLIALPLCVRYLERGARRLGGVAAALAAFALVTNPRSGIALAALLAGSVLAVVSSGKAIDTAGRRAALLVALAGLLAAPEIASLIRFGDLYYFVHYSGYANAGEFLESSIRAVSGPFFLLGIAGILLALRPGAGTATRAAAVTVALYVAGTVLLSEGTGPAALIDQLETTRLMPFQRLLWFYLAASALETTLVRLGTALRRRSRLFLVDCAMLAASAAVALLYVLAPPSFIPIEDRGLTPVPVSARPGIRDLEEAVRIADEEAPPGTALLVLGTLNTPLSWHDQLWAPLWSDRPFFYDDWLWYWQTRHAGDYNPEIEHAYVDDASALSPSYLRRHGIGAIVVTGDARAAASQAAHLTAVRSGTWDVYRVNEATPIVTFDGSAPTAIEVGEQRLSATGNLAGGEIVIRRNWYPRWQATINGDPVSIRQTDDGYMAISTSAPGAVELELRYGTDWIDWAARLAALAGGLLTLAMVLPSGGRFRLRGREPKPVPRVIPTGRSERR